MYAVKGGEKGGRMGVREKANAEDGRGVDFVA